jgi:uncharacterized protein YdeI (YjbR/CyaY-like superfamily)
MVKAKVMATNRKEIFFETRRELRTWLATNHNEPVGIWALFYKKSTGLSDLSWEAIVEECLCFGWIDSLPGKVDESRTKIYISPRKANSGWSRRNKVLLIELQPRGMIEEPGVAIINRAKVNGSWERFDLAEDLVIPKELDNAFGHDQDFWASWQSLSESKRRQFLQQIYDAKTDATKEKREYYERGSEIRQFIKIR